jgi:cysteine/O-acetylserine efflux protein
VEKMNVLSYFLYTIVVTATPGPTNIDILNTIKNRGTKAGLKYTYGASAAFFTLLIISAILNTFLVAIMPNLLIAMKIIGSVYMLYLVYMIFKKHDNDKGDVNLGTFKSGFKLQFLNPKVITFTMTVIPTFVLVYYKSVSMITIYIIVTSMIAMFAFSLWLIFGSLLQNFLRRHELGMNIVMAIFLFYAAIMVWF